VIDSTHPRRDVAGVDYNPSNTIIFFEDYSGLSMGKRGREYRSLRFNKFKK